MTLKERIKTKPGYKMLAIAGLVILAGYGADYVAPIPKKAVAPVLQSHTPPLSSEQTKLVEYCKVFDAHKSPDPYRMAKAVVSTKNPKRMAAVAIIESNGNPKAKGKSGERGAFQVIEKEFGKVSKNPTKQARQSEDILEDLVRESHGNLKVALRKYNGGPDYQKKPATKVYANKILAKIKEMP